MLKQSLVLLVAILFLASAHAQVVPAGQNQLSGLESRAYKLVANEHILANANNPNLWVLGNQGMLARFEHYQIKIPTSIAQSGDLEKIEKALRVSLENAMGRKLPAANNRFLVTRLAQLEVEFSEFQAAQDALNIQLAANGKGQNLRVVNLMKILDSLGQNTTFLAQLSFDKQLVLLDELINDLE